MELDRSVEFDLPPEYCRYRDEGCDLAASCLNCPFEQCVHDEPGGKQRLVKNLRDNEMARLFSSASKGVNELSEIFSVSQRTVQRALKAVLSNATGRGRNNERRIQSFGTKAP